MLGFGKSDGDAASENERLRRALHELEVLEDIAAETASDQPLQATIDNITNRCVERFNVEEGVVHLFEQAQPSEQWRTIVRQAGTRFGGQAFRPTDQLIGWVLKHRRTLRINNQEESPVSNLISAELRSLLSAPLRFQGNLIGVLNLINRKTEDGFSEEDEKVLSIIAAQAAHLIYTAHLIGELRESRTALQEENSALLSRLQGELKTQIVGSSPSLIRILRLIRQIRDTNVDVLISGESGTGKELIAKAVHESSSRSDGPFVALNCAALPETLLESELFGIEKGVATGVDRRAGQFEAADGGTLFLDEIGELDLAGQAKILRALQERVVQRVGGRVTFPVDVRIVAATNKDLEAEVKKGEFREDLLYRLKVIHLRVPALRERREDIPLLISYFAEPLFAGVPTAGGALRSRRTRRAIVAGLARQRSRAAKRGQATDHLFRQAVDPIARPRRRIIADDRGLRSGRAGGDPSNRRIRGGVREETSDRGLADSLRQPDPNGQGARP